MIKISPLIILSSLLVLALAGCAAAATPLQPGGQPTSLPPTQTPAPTATSVPPTETPTKIPPTQIATATATATPADVIQHYPSGQDFTVTSIDMIDANTGWAIGSLTAQTGDHVLVTADGGNTWKDVTPPEPASPADQPKAAVGYFQDKLTAWVTYSAGGGVPVPSNPVVWHTSDGGNSWSASQPLDVTNLNEFFVPSSLQFVAGQDGWLLVHVGAGMMHDYVAIYRSSDGGMSWTRIIDPYIDGGIQSCSKTAMLFTDATHGWLTGDCNGVKAGALLFKTSDAGSSWQEVNLPEPVNYPGIFAVDTQDACGTYDPFFFGNDLGHLSVTCKDYSKNPITSTYFIYTTQDGGNTWTSAAYPGEALYFISADTGWALAAKIQLTKDGGKTWAPISDVTWTPQMDFISEQIGWAVATDNNQVALVYSDDGGARWSELSPSVGP
jgi:photosystem II stability/assembly factor-like uncharacterized protein